jgi:predicted acetyltransferase
MNYQLRTLTPEDEQAYLKFLEDWKDENLIVPYSARLLGKTFEAFLEFLKLNEKNSIDPMNRVPETIYVMVDDQQTIVGALSLRHYLNQRLYELRGHIGYGIAPSFRKQGLGSLMLKMSFEYCKTMNIPEVLITCDKTNIGSSLVIQNNGGILENEVLDVDHYIQRYWIRLNS